MFGINAVRETHGWIVQSKEHGYLVVCNRFRCYRHNAGKIVIFNTRKDAAGSAQSNDTIHRAIVTIALY